jgi:tRNA-modifying protein YgfZ
VVDVSDHTQIELTGSDAAPFLNRLCTNQVDRLTPGSGCEAFLSDPKGRVVAYFFVFRHADSLVLHSAAGQAAAILAHLDRYRIRDRVQFHDRSGQWREFLLAGERSEVVLSRLTTTLPAQSHLAHVEVDVAGIRCSIRRLEFGLPAMLLISFDGDAAETTWTAVQKAGARPCGQLAMKAIRIEAGWPVYGVDISAENLPQEIGRDDRTICYRKGCYLGQETVARIESRGHVNRLLVGLKFQTPDVPAPNTELLLDERTAGRVTSGMFSPYLGSALALAYVSRGASQPGVQLASPMGPAEVVALPLRN